MKSKRFLVIVLLLSSTAAIAHFAERRVPEALAAPLESISDQVAGWHAVSAAHLEPGVLKALAPTSYLARTYSRGRDGLELFIAFYEQQRAGEAMHSPKACLPGSGWEIWDYDSAFVPVNGTSVKINKYFIRNASTKSLLLYWYQSPHRITASEYLGKILLVRDTILTGHTAGSIVRIILPDRPGASKDGVEFAASIIPEVQRCFTGPPNLPRAVDSSTR